MNDISKQNEQQRQARQNYLNEVFANPYRNITNDMPNVYMPGRKK